MNGESTRWGILGLVIVLAAGGLYLAYEESRPCMSPVKFAIGEIDQRFSTSAAEVLKESKSAMLTWNGAAGRSVLEYDPEARLKINLIYDEREANAKLGQEIARQQADVDESRESIERMRSIVEASQAFYNEEIRQVNARGGASRQEARLLDTQLDSLKQEQQALNVAVSSFNATVRELNGVVADYNRTAGKTFKQGEYVRDSAGERINIFMFIGTDQLERVLAHEFGHAIGLDHNSDPSAIMYEKNESGNLKPTAADLSALRALCGSL